MGVIQNRLASRAEAKWVILAQESGFSKTFNARAASVLSAVMCLFTLECTGGVCASL